MTKAQSKPSQQEAENFHVLPKDKSNARPPASDPGDTGSGRIADRDADAGSLTGQGSSNQEVNQPLRDQERDRSQVS